MTDSTDEMARLIADVRHDANNSLMAILGYLDNLVAREDLPVSVSERLKRCLVEARKLRDCIARTSHIQRPD